MRIVCSNRYLRDIVERNLEIAAQCCIDICHRIIAVEHALKPSDYYEAILRMGELGVLPVDFARTLAAIAGFRDCWRATCRTLQSSY
jgi:uncharacterized protein YutE (UPF0331/DUF86 family)